MASPEHLTGHKVPLGVYISGTVPESGKSLISLGLADALHRHADRIGFFRPIVGTKDPDADPMVAMIRSLYQLDPAVCVGGVDLASARGLLASGNVNDLLAGAVERYSQISKSVDVVVVEGSDLRGPDVVTELSLNAQLANNLGLPVLAVVGARGLSQEESVEAVSVAQRVLAAAHCSLLGVIINRAKPELVDTLAELVNSGLKAPPIYVIPEIDEVSRPTVAEMTAGLVPIAGRLELDRDVLDVKVAAMTVANFLGVLDPGDLVIVPGDRADVVVASLASALSPGFPVPSAMVLTDGMSPEPKVRAFLDKAPFPVFATSQDTYSTARAASSVRSEIHAGQARKVAAALGAWSRYVDEPEVLRRLTLPRPTTTTPSRFLHELIERARTQKRRIG